MELQVKCFVKLLIIKGFYCLNLFFWIISWEFGAAGENLCPKPGETQFNSDNLSDGSDNRKEIF